MRGEIKGSCPIFMFNFCRDLVAQFVSSQMLQEVNIVVGHEMERSCSLCEACEPRPDWPIHFEAHSILGTVEGDKGGGRSRSGYHHWSNDLEKHCGTAEHWLKVVGSETALYDEYVLGTIAPELPNESRANKDAMKRHEDASVQVMRPYRGLIWEAEDYRTAVEC